MEYRKDIDGLRCVAVLSVLLYHIQNQLLPGGFVGVDIFFVISGFLITRIIKCDLENENFNISRFYARRIRRIFPALFTVLFCTLIVAVLALEPDTFVRFTENFRYAALQLSNFKFAQQLGYFDAGNELSPLLHTWSLGVEEQFYLIWPALLLLSFRYLKEKSIFLLVVIGVTSFFISDYLSHESPQNAFYMLHSRAWELSAGGIVAFLIDNTNRSRVLNTIYSLLGAGLLFYGLFEIDNTMIFPGKNALFPVVGAALLIYSGQQRTFISSILKRSPCIFIGKISYSLYLWHWPLIVFFKVTQGNEINLADGCIIFTLTIILSVITYFFVEQPFRSKTVFSGTGEGVGTTRRSIYAGILVVLVCVVFSYRFESVGPPTTLTIDVHTVKSPSDFKEETFAVYWICDKVSGFSQKQSTMKLYRKNRTVESEVYRFIFSLPPLQDLSAIRIDPLTGEGVVEIASVRLTGGIFNTTRSFTDLSFLLKPGTLVSDNVDLSVKHNKLHVQSRSVDPYFVLLPEIPVLYETEIAILFIVIIFSLVVVATRARQHLPNYKTTILCGFAMVLFTLLVSYRAQFSAHSAWRFIRDDKSSVYWTLAERRADLEKYTHHKTAQVILWGDSHVENFNESVGQWAQRRNLDLTIKYIPACPPMVVDKEDLDDLDSIAVWDYRSCFSNNEKILQSIEKNSELEYVFLVMRYEFYLNHPYMLFIPAKIGKNDLSREEYFRRSFLLTINRIRESGKKIVLLGQVPVLKANPIKCMKMNQTILASIFKYNPQCDIDKKFSDSALNLGINLFEKIAAEDDAIFFFQPQKYITSVYGSDGALKYHDDNHLNAYGAGTLVKPFIDELSFLGATDPRESY